MMKEANLPLYTRRDKGGNARQFSIVDFAIYKGLLPTPTCQDAKQKENSPSQQHKIQELAICVAGGSGFQLNPPFVGEMMGFPPTWTELPFLNGEVNQSKPTETP
jgi:hypothetical protein